MSNVTNRKTEILYRPFETNHNDGNCDDDHSNNRTNNCDDYNHCICQNKLKNVKIVLDERHTKFVSYSLITRHSLEFIGGNFCQFLFVLVFSLFKCVS